MPDSTAISSRSLFSRLCDRATCILAMRDHSEYELRRKLALPMIFTHNGVEKSIIGNNDDIDKVISWCHEYHWIDDNKFAQQLIRSRSRKGYGPQYIYQKLQQKGISREIREAAMFECQIDWHDIAQNVAWRKFGSPLPTDWPSRAKIQRFLLYRGFFMEDIKSLY